MVFDAGSGEPAALINGDVLSTMRMAATSRLAIRLLANEDASIAAILGAGVQAHAHAQAVLRERTIGELRIADRDRAAARALAQRLACATDARIVPSHSYEQALRGAHVVCAPTASPEPVVRREWLDDGVHVNSVGFALEGREIAAEVVCDALVVVEDRESSLLREPTEANDLTSAISDGVVAPDAIHAELGEVLLDPGRGRTRHEQITLGGFNWCSQRFAVEGIVDARRAPRRVCASRASCVVCC